MKHTTRDHMKIYLFLLIQLLILSACTDKTNNEEIKVYRDPNCQCCHKWINHLEENKFNVLDILTTDMTSIKESVQLPKKMASCHTAIIEGYVIEGHVPAADIRRLLAEKPDIAGLSVPQMPVGTPGMEMGERKDNFIVFQFNKEGKYSTFNSYQLDEHNNYQTHLPPLAEH
tara:strand:- start:36215 stop:36730 length:516 start_codon:yes stop_codon:yes gene_type:complete